MWDISRVTVGAATHKGRCLSSFSRVVTRTLYSSVSGQAIPSTFGRFGVSITGLAPVKKDGKVGFINSKGAWVIEPSFDYALPFSEGLAAVYINNVEKWGFTNNKGEVVIDPTFSSLGYGQSSLEAKIGSFHEGLAYVGDGFIDKKGQYVIRGEYLSSTNFHKGFARIIKLNRDQSRNIINGFTGYINKKGDLIWSTKISYIEDIIQRSEKYGGYNYAFYEDNQ